MTYKIKCQFCNSERIKFTERTEEGIWFYCDSCNETFCNSEIEIKNIIFQLADYLEFFIINYSDDKPSITNIENVEAISKHKNLIHIIESLDTETLYNILNLEKSNTDYKIEDIYFAAVISKRKKYKIYL